jgi:hypothetical protein
LLDELQRTGPLGIGGFTGQRPKHRQVNPIDIISRFPQHSLGCVLCLLGGKRRIAKVKRLRRDIRH